MLKNYPIDQQPREKATRHGVESLSDVELIALIVRTGTRDLSAIDLARKIINELGGFNYLKTASLNQLIKIKGIKKAKAIELLAIIEVAKRLINHHDQKFQIKEAIDGYNLIKNKLTFEQQEKVMLVCLNNKLEVVKEKIIFIGTNNLSLISGKELFKEAIASGVSRIMVIHNHPSGNPQPSNEDRRVTKQLKEMANILDMELIDHLIIGHHCFYSFSNEKIFYVE